MTENVTVAVFSEDETVHEVIGALKEADIGADHVSVAGPAGKVKPLEEEVQGFHTTKHRIKEGAKWGGWIGGIGGVVGGAAIFIAAVPVGPIVAVGGLAAILAGAIEGAVLGAGVGVLATALASMGIKEPEAKELEQRIAAGEFLVIVKGPAELVNRADSILKASDPIHVVAA
ncbi:MAG: hypothetical protein KAX16_05095 [Actinomycetia bacterium]|nr:hypothetical protein [Actinomycetes bacterium]